MGGGWEESFQLTVDSLGEEKREREDLTQRAQRVERRDTGEEKPKMAG